MGSIKNAPVPFFIKPITNMIVNRVYENYLTPTYFGNFQFLEDILEGKVSGAGNVVPKEQWQKKKWFVGDGEGEFSGVDVLLSYPLVAASDRVAGYNGEKFPRIFEWIDRIRAREAFKRAEERTREYETEM